MKNIRFIQFLIIGLLCLSACSEEKTTSISNPLNSKGKQEYLTGDKFADSAATHIMKHNAGLSRRKANCVVQNMIGDGRYGLGEINQMKLTSDNMSKNASGLNKAYSAAIQVCQ